MIVFFIIIVVKRFFFFCLLLFLLFTCGCDQELKTARGCLLRSHSNLILVISRVFCLSSSSIYTAIGGVGA